MRQAPSVAHNIPANLTPDTDTYPIKQCSRLYVGASLQVQVQDQNRAFMLCHILMDFDILHAIFLGFLYLSIN